ncbi:MAG TPA: PPOX class F420-dependent oxidoreductase [Tepidiformaceae bacterium]|nr:PPOX class F420-dependent oxidoreductase [Tepidiformaceae bacterium]
MPEMSPAERDAFLRETRIAKLATLKGDGSPIIVPVWFEWDGTTAAIFTGRESPKIHRIERDPRVALSVEEGVGVAEAWVTIEGTARIEEGGIDLARRLAQRYYEPPRRDEAVARWERFAENLVVIRVAPTRIRSSAPEAGSS